MIEPLFSTFQKNQIATSSKCHAGCDKMTPNLLSLDPLQRVSHKGNVGLNNCWTRWQPEIQRV
jgi:hypothetical protein